MPSLNDDRRLSRTLIFRLMCAENKNCEAFWSRLPEKINFLGGRFDRDHSAFNWTWISELIYDLCWGEASAWSSEETEA